MNTITSLCFVRHGETDWNYGGFTQGSTDIPLNDTGRRQADETARVLGEHSWDALLSSPLGRAMETARIIGDRIGITDIVQEARLVERAYGSAEGMPAAERKRNFPDKVIPGAEPWDAVRERTYAALERILEEYRGKRIIAVSHGGTILNLLSELSNGVYGPGTLTLENASMHLVEYDGRWHMRWCNRTAESYAAAL